MCMLRHRLFGWWLVVSWMDWLRLGAYCRSSKRLYAWTWSRRCRRRGGLIVNTIMSEMRNKD